MQNVKLDAFVNNEENEEVNQITLRNRSGESAGLVIVTIGQQVEIHVLDLINEEEVKTDVVLEIRPPHWQYIRANNVHVLASFEYVDKNQFSIDLDLYLGNETYAYATAKDLVGNSIIQPVFATPLERS